MKYIILGTLTFILFFLAWLALKLEGKDNIK